VVSLQEPRIKQELMCRLAAVIHPLGGFLEENSRNLQNSGEIETHDQL